MLLKNNKMPIIKKFCPSCKGGKHKRMGQTCSTCKGTGVIEKVVPIKSGKNDKNLPKKMS